MAQSQDEDARGGCFTLKRFYYVAHRDNPVRFVCALCALYVRKQTPAAGRGYSVDIIKQTPAAGRGYREHTKGLTAY